MILVSNLAVDEGRTLLRVVDSQAQTRSIIRDTLGITERELDEILQVVCLKPLAELASVLRQKIIPDRIPKIVRRPDEKLGGRSILESLRSEGGEPVNEYLQRLFSYVSEV